MQSMGQNRLSTAPGGGESSSGGDKRSSVAMGKMVQGSGQDLFAMSLEQAEKRSAAGGVSRQSTAHRDTLVGAASGQATLQRGTSATAKRASVAVAAGKRGSVAVAAGKSDSVAEVTGKRMSVAQQSRAKGGDKRGSTDPMAQAFARSSARESQSKGTDLFSSQV